MLWFFYKSLETCQFKRPAAYRRIRYRYECLQHRLRIDLRVWYQNPMFRTYIARIWWMKVRHQRNTHLPSCALNGP
jgi:hypothetical protein